MNEPSAFNAKALHQKDFVVGPEIRTGSGSDRASKIVDCRLRISTGFFRSGPIANWQSPIGIRWTRSLPLPVLIFSTHHQTIHSLAKRGPYLCKVSRITNLVLSL